jgi:hypothetical protein
VSLPLTWIVGPESNPDGDPSWEAIARLAQEVREALLSIDPWSASVLQVLVMTIARGLGQVRRRPQLAALKRE